MVPSPKELEAALIDGTYQIFTSEPDATTVNKVRKRVEEERGLEEGFFTSEEWKQKSKTLIKEYVEKLLDGWVPGPKDDSESKNGTKRLASEDESSLPKRQKHRNGGAKSKGRADDATETKAQTTKTASRRKSKEASSNREPEDVKKMDSPPEGSEDDDALSSIKVVGTSQTPAQQEEEEYSDVVDEGPKPKRKKKEPKHASSKSSKLAAKKATTPSTDDPQEAEIKKLQSQLVKCGVRKLWHNELKQYGDDCRAKIRHLKKMLTGIGMDGRFSEAKAREIKETRELLADVDAAKEMNALWGMNSGRRASRSKNKSPKVENSEDSKDSDVEGGAAEIGGYEEEAREKEGEGEGEGEDDQETTSFAARRRRAQADLAFLGDDSESD